MRKRIREENINTREYLETAYANYQGDPHINYRLERLVEKVGEYNDVLDVGCSDGTFLRLYGEKFSKASLYGCDLAENAVKKCVIGECKQGDIYSLPYQDKMFDLVTCSETLEHLEQPEEAIKELRRVAKKDGVIAITVPNETDGHCDEHLWRWDFDGFRELLTGLELLEYKKEFYPHIMLFICKLA